ncbi:MAG TPA: tetratricopeptide repeat protein [Thermoanaerobaculia bacterium]|nr:tetratricopeptide repeat protein [Thermoanaerobaculia bacterium]
MHLSRELIQAVVESKMPPRAFLDFMLHHLLDLCPDCRREWNSYQTSRRDPVGSYERAFAVLNRLAKEEIPRLQKEELRSARDYRDLMGLPKDARASRITKAYRRFRAPALVERLLKDCRSSVTSRPREAHHFADLAYLVAVQLSGSSVARELQSLSLGELANATRAGGDLISADQRLSQARKVIKIGGVTDLRVAARLDSLEGSLRKDQRRFREAREALRRALLLYRSVGEQRQIATVLMKLSIIHSHEGKYSEAVAVGLQAIELLSQEEDYALYLAARHNLGFYLVEYGQLDEALSIVEIDERAHRSLGQPLFQIRYTWLRGRIAARAGDLDSAEACFRKTRDTFIAAGIGYDAALVSLDLALAYLRANRLEETRALAEEIAPIFQAQDVHREAFAALVLFRDAATQQTLTVELVRKLWSYFLLARTDKSFRFTI